MNGYVTVPVKVYVPFWMVCMTSAVCITVFYTWGWVLIALGMPLPLGNMESIQWYFRYSRKLSKLFFALNIAILAYILLRIMYPEINID